MQDLNLLTALDALLETNSVTAAADLMHVSPPAMSRTLGRLRRALGDPILVRAGRQLTPTPFADSLRTRVRTAVAEAAELLRPAGTVELESLQRTFTIRGNEQVPAIFAAPLLRRIADEAPQVTLRFVPEGDENIDDLRSGRVDLDIGSQHGLPPDIIRADLFTDTIVAVVAKGHRLTHGPVTPARLAGEGHISMSRRGRTRGPLAIAAETDLVAILPSVAASISPLQPSLAQLRLPVPVPSFAAAMIWHRHLDVDPAHRWLREQVRAVAPAT
jgi:DNA-binding transcriptional LysR family regulator